jgi:hypothetical protein
MGKTAERIATDGYLYMRSSDSRRGNWQRLEFPFDGTAFLSVPELDGDFTMQDAIVRGVPTFKISSERVMDGVVRVVNTYEVSVGKEDSMVHRLNVRSEGTSNDGPVVQTITYEFFDFNKRVSIEVPDV